MPIPPQLITNRIGKFARCHNAIMRLSARQRESSRSGMECGSSAAAFLGDVRNPILNEVPKLSEDYLVRITRQVMSSDCRVKPTKSSTRFIKNCNDSVAPQSGSARMASIQRALPNSWPFSSNASTTPSV